MRPTPINHEVRFRTTSLQSQNRSKGNNLRECPFYKQRLHRRGTFGCSAQHTAAPRYAKGGFQTAVGYDCGRKRDFCICKNPKQRRQLLGRGSSHPLFDDNGTIIAYHSVRRKPSSKTINMITQVYSQMLSIEGKSGVEASAKYLFDSLKTKRGLAMTSLSFSKAKYINIF